MPPFDLSEIDTPSYEPFPAGKYRLMVTENEWTTFSTGAEGWKATLEVQGGDYEGRKVFRNVVFPTEETMRTDPDKAQKTLGFVKAFLLSLGFDNDDLKDFDPEEMTSELINRECIGVIAIKKETEQYAASNDLKRTLPLDDSDTVLP